MNSPTDSSWLKQTSKWQEWTAIGKIGGCLVMRFVFTFVREKVKFVREKSVKCQGISRGPVCGNHDQIDC